MMGNLSSWICGLMRENYDAVGFIPFPSVEYQYIKNGRYVLQNNEFGRPVGYLLHGKIETGRPCVISQHCIQYENRLKGYGEMAFKELLGRCFIYGASSIHLRVAQDLPAIAFWVASGFSVVRVIPGGKSRNRMIVEMIMNLELPLFTIASAR